MAASSPLVLKFSTDVAGAQKGLAQLSASVASNMKSISSAASLASKTMSAVMAEGTQKALAEARKTGDWGKVGIAMSQSFRRGLGDSIAAAAGEVNKLDAAMRGLNAASKYGPEAAKLAFAAHNPVLTLGLQLLQPYARGIMAASLAVGGLAAAWELSTLAEKAARESLDEYVSIATNAKNAGVGTTFFQTWALQARDLKFETADLTAMLDKAREAATRHIGEKGEASSSVGLDRLQQNVKAGNLTRADLAGYNAADTQQARITAVLDLIQKLEASGRRLAAFDLANTFFGDKFEAQLRNGVDMVGKMRAAMDGAQSAGGMRVISEEEIANAQRMRAELDTIHDQLSDMTSSLLKEISLDQQSILEGTIQWEAKLVTIVTHLRDAAAWIKGIGKDMADWSGWTDVVQVFDRLGLADKEMPDFVKQGQAEARADAAKQAPAQSTISLPDITVHGDKSKSLPDLHPKEKKSASEADQVKTYLDQLSKQAAAEQAEARMLGMSNQAREEAVNLAKAQEDARALAATMSQTFESAIEGMIVSGNRLSDVLHNLASSLESMALKAILTGEEPLASSKLFQPSAAMSAQGVSALPGGLIGALMGTMGDLGMNAAGGKSGGGSGPLGGLFSGFFANGGTIPSGHFGIAGEAGPELIQGPASIVPSRQIEAALGAGSSGRNVSITHAPVLNVTPANGVTPQELAKVMEQNNRNFARAIPSILSNHQKRFS
ncbi:hypothetical protein [Beijerinckia mobilis]|uniref:hypothetical protein n=1 Tax=Beijerinckia mobilis TaxID=231434 RepID=UPI0005542BBA|nr:hypothetical protein [Beijerinckia mobilis]